MKKEKLSLEPYKGTRDFYPEDQFVEDYIFSVMRRVVERYGYEPYNASIIEDAALYRAKSGEEIVNEQTYTFTDRGGREVTLRPEMTPTVARMIAKRRQELPFPLRWYSIPNVFRYERPQRGRLREHWQLNADLFGASGVLADAEMISMAYDLMKEFGAKEKDFEIRVNDRGIVRWIVENGGLKGDQVDRYLSLLDKKSKMTDAEFEEISQKEFGLSHEILDMSPGDSVREVIDVLKKRGIKNVFHDKNLVRGFAYYTGVVFEVYDTNKENPRSLFGGGRYDELLDIFGAEPVPAVGFGMGDVTIRDYLETHKLLPEYVPNTQIYICEMENAHAYAAEVAEYLRGKGMRVAEDFTERKIGAQMKAASKQKVPFVVVIGEDEAKSKKLTLKDMASGKEWKLKKEEVLKKMVK